MVNNVACLDSQILIWGIKEESDPNQEEMIPLAKALIQRLEDEKVLIIIPTIVLAEVMANIPEDEQEGFISKIQKRFMVIPFDINASSHFVEIFNLYFEKLKTEKICTREHLKADLLIAATALSVSTAKLYTYDKGLLKIQHNSMECTKITNTQLPLI